MAIENTSVHHLRAGGVSLVLDTHGGGLPSVLHWGADLGELSEPALAALALGSAGPYGDSRVEVPERVSILASPAEGWTLTPGLTGSRDGRDFSPSFRLVDNTPIESSDEVADGRRFVAEDGVARLSITLEIVLTRAGVVKLRAILTNRAEVTGEGTETYRLERLILSMPVPSEAVEVMDFTGRHTRERIPQRSEFRVGTHLRESRKGKPGLDSAFLLTAGEAHFGFTSGEVWALHLGWSGNQVSMAERGPNGFQVLAGGELLLPGEISLASGQGYTSPWLYAGYGDGLNALAGRFHTMLRARPGHPRTARPIVVNTWEAVYFSQHLDELMLLAKTAAQAGAERFVLDDGWFRGRRSDGAGLGDWTPDPDVWPEGLHPLIDGVRELGLEFGLWVEPEMVNLDSDLARAHPDWLFSAGGRLGLPSRNQHVLDLGHPEAYAHIAGLLHALLDTYDIQYLKWDHNSSVVEAGHSPTGVPGVHQQVLATYRLMDELKERHPGLEIESCAGGGGRIDLGILGRTDRVWPTDCLDPLERQSIQRWTSLLLPPELCGTHFGSPVDHTTGRRQHIDFRAQTAFWGHLGIEADLSQLAPSELDRLAEWIELHKRFRPLLHTGRVFVADHPDEAVWVHGVAAQDGSEALVGIVSLRRSLTWPPGRFRLPGLARTQSYAVTPLLATDALLETTWTPEWMRTGVVLNGQVLDRVGLQLPALLPERSVLLHLSAVHERHIPSPTPAPSRSAAHRRGLTSHQRR